MLTKGMKKMIEHYIINECDDIIVDVLAEKLKIDIHRDGDELVFNVTFADQIIANDRIGLK